MKVAAFEQVDAPASRTDVHAFDTTHEIDPTKVIAPFDSIVCAGMRGAESAALIVAHAAAIHVGGWAHKDSTTPPANHKTPPVNNWSSAVVHNVRDSDATIVFTFSQPNGPTRLALRRADGRHKPNLHVMLRPRGSVSADAIGKMRAWITKHEVSVLHVTGSRQETDPGIEQAVVDVLVAILEAV